MQLLFSFTVGGTERLVTDISNRLVQLGHEVHLYIINDLYADDMLECLSSEIKVYFQNRKVGGGDKIKTVFAVTGYIKKNHIDVVHCNSFSAPELMILKPFCFPHIKIVHTIHDMNSYDGLSYAKVKLRNFLIDDFIAISKSVERNIAGHGADNKKISVIYNAINLDRFYPKDYRSNSNTSFVLGNVARIMPDKKGQDILLQAISNVVKTYPDIECRFAGNEAKGYEGSIQNLKEQADHLGISKNVIFNGNVNDIPAFLSQINLFVLPSRHEGFGIALIEAMAMGIPCIASNLDGPAEIIGKEERGLLFQPENVNDLSEKIVYVIEHYKERQEVAKEAAKYIASKFDIQSMCEQLLCIYS